MIKVVIGLGNPGQKFHYTRHNIGFLVVDELVKQYHGIWVAKKDYESADITVNNQSILVIKPQTFMNSSGAIIPQFQKKGITSQEIVVIHDELELPFGKVTIKLGGSVKGHNGLKSLISYMGDQFYRIRCGIGRPEHREDVPDYVLSSFSPAEDTQTLIHKAIKILEELLQTN